MFFWLMVGLGIFKADLYVYLHTRIFDDVWTWNNNLNPHDFCLALNSTVKPLNKFIIFYPDEWYTCAAKKCTNSCLSNDETEDGTIYPYIWWYILSCQEYWKILWVLFHNVDVEVTKPKKTPFSDSRIFPMTGNILPSNKSPRVNLHLNW